MIAFSAVCSRASLSSDWLESLEEDSGTEDVSGMAEFESGGPDDDDTSLGKLDEPGAALVDVLGATTGVSSLPPSLGERTNFHIRNPAAISTTSNTQMRKTRGFFLWGAGSLSSEYSSSKELGSGEGVSS